MYKLADFYTRIIRYLIVGTLKYLLTALAKKYTVFNHKYGDIIGGHGFKTQRHKMHQEIIEILQQRTESEDRFDELASLIIDNESKEGRHVSLSQAYTKLAQASGKDSKQDERLQKIQAIVSGSMFETKHQLIKRQKLLLGYIAKDDPLLAQYEILILNFRDDILETDDFKQYHAFCNEAKKLVKKPKTYVLCRDYSGRRCQILYFEKPEQYPELTIIPHNHIHRDELYNTFSYPDQPDIPQQHKLRLTRFALLSHQYPENLQNFLIFAAAKNNNPKILRYFIRLALQLKVDISKTLKQCLDFASANHCTSNVRAILSEYKSIPAGFHNHYGRSSTDKFYLRETAALINGKELNTRSPLIEIFYILADYKCEDLKLENYLSIPATNQKKREIVSINLLIHKQRADDVVSYSGRGYTQEFYNNLIDLINDYFSDNKPLSFEFYRNNLEMFNADAKKVKSLCYLADFFANQENFEYMEKIVFRWGREGSKLEQMQDYLSIEGVIALNASYSKISSRDLPSSVKDEKQFLIKLGSLSKTLIQNLNEFLKTILPSDITSIVQQYLIMPAFLQEYYKTICSIMEPQQSTLELKGEDDKHVWKFKTSIQDQKSSDCGYWSLFNMFRVFTATVTNNINPEDEKDLTNLFLGKFKPWVSNIIHKQKEDLTVLDLDKVISIAQEGDKDLTGMFPELQKNLQTYQDSYGMPAYTLINSVLCDGDNKLDHSYTFGGCLPHLKIQIAINFYQLSQMKKQPIFHFVFIGANGHWHVQLLEFSHYSKNSQSIIRLDSSVTPQATVARIHLHIQDLMNNPLNYAKNIAEEVLPIVNDDLLKMLAEEKLLNPQQNETALNYCMAIVKFFTTFGAHEMIKSHLPVLQNAHKLARKCREFSYDFTQVTQELVRLCQLQLKAQLSKNHFLITASSSSPASSPSGHCQYTHS